MTNECLLICIYLEWVSRNSQWEKKVVFLLISREKLIQRWPFTVAHHHKMLELKEIYYLSFNRYA